MENRLQYYNEKKVTELLEEDIKVKNRNNDLITENYIKAISEKYEIEKLELMSKTLTKADLKKDSEMNMVYTPAALIFAILSILISTFIAIISGLSAPIEVVWIFIFVFVCLLGLFLVISVTYLKFRNTRDKRDYIILILELAIEEKQKSSSAVTDSTLEPIQN